MSAPRKEPKKIGECIPGDVVVVSMPVPIEDTGFVDDEDTTVRVLMRYAGGGARVRRYATGEDGGEFGEEFNLEDARRVRVVRMQP